MGDGIIALIVGIVVVVLNLALLAATVAVVVWVLRAMGVIA